MGMRIADVFLTLLADGAKLQPQVEAEAAKAGDAGAKTLGERLGSGLKTGALRAFGTAATAAFALATKGAIQLQEVQARIQAETGATAEEAEHMAAVVNRVAGDNRMALDEVADAAIRVRRDLGATGAEADALTASFAEFARVTRQDAAGAVEDFDDMLDSWGLEASDAQGVMDRLLVSQQKFGGAIEDNQKTLAALAPAMRAANMEIDDGIALLGLFGSKGLDANAASAAFAKALTKVKSPEELQRLIDDISATEDPFLRAEKAADLFGARAGAKLANALGGVHLDDFAIDMDDAAGATRRAAEALDNTPWGFFQKKASQAAAALRGFGADAGPVLTSLAALASLLGTLGLDKAFVGAFKKVGSSAAVKGAAAAAGAVGGAVYAAAAGATEKLVGALAGAWKAIPGSAAVTAGAKAAGSAIGTAIVGSLVAALAFGIGTFLAGLSVSQFIKDQSGMSEEEWQDAVYGNYSRMGGKPVPPEVKRTSEAIGYKVGHIVREATGDAIEQGVSDVPDRMRTMIIGAGQEAEKIPEAIGEGILEKQGRVRTAMDRLKFLMDNIMTRMEEVAYLSGVTTSKRLARALQDGRPDVRAQAQAVLFDWEGRMTALIKGGGKAGKQAQKELRQALKSEIPEVRAAAERVKNAAVGEFEKVPPAAGREGRQAGNEFVRQMKNAITGQTIRINAGVQVSLGVISGARALGGPTKANEAYWINERGPEIFVPEQDGRVLSHAESVAAVSAAAGGGGGNTYNMPLTVQGALPVRTLQDIATEHRRIAELGQLPPAALPPLYQRGEARA
jgi:hypothetical protein